MFRIVLKGRKHELTNKSFLKIQVTRILEKYEKPRRNRNRSDFDP